jgi:hypothetical protein
MKTYKIIRSFMHHPSEVIEEGLSLKEAQEHCKDPETSSSRCTSAEGIALTARKGPWFDGYDEE